jgi:Cof subfamily protein (haloacid dehalogenase superfamily)
MIRLIAADLDGTLLNNQSLLTERTRSAVARAMGAGARFVLATGRMSDSTREFARELSTNAPVIAFNGALAMEWATGEVLFAHAIAPKIAREVCAMAERCGIFIQYFPERGFFYERRVPEISDEYEGRIRMRGQVAGRALSEWIDRPAFKLLTIGEHEALVRLRDDIHARFPGLKAMLSHPTYLEIVTAGVDKGAALETLARMYGIARDEIAAFGDADNDAGMIEYAGMGYCMENGYEDVKERSKNIAPPNDLDGVARVLETLLAENSIGG